MRMSGLSMRRPRPWAPPLSKAVWTWSAGPPAGGCRWRLLPGTCACRPWRQWPGRTAARGSSPVTRRTTTPRPWCREWPGARGSAAWQASGRPDRSAAVCVSSDPFCVQPGRRSCTTCGTTACHGGRTRPTPACGSGATRSGPGSCRPWRPRAMPRSWTCSRTWPWRPTVSTATQCCPRRPWPGLRWLPARSPRAWISMRTGCGTSPPLSRSS